MTSEENKNISFWPGFFLGGLIGALLLFLWGTKEGKKIALLLAEKGELLEEDIVKKLSYLDKNFEKIPKENIKKDTPTKNTSKSPTLLIPKDSNQTVVKNRKTFFKKDGKTLSS